jgi:peroxiredoxin
MGMQKFVFLAILLAFGVRAIAVLPVPRKSPEFEIVEPSNKHALLSSFKGKVVLIEFLMTNCPHCQRVSRTISKLQQELGPRGFQPIGIAFEPGLTERMVTGFTKQFGVTYPLGYSTPEAVDSYLSRSTMERLMVPQIVVIDREGVIRAQNGAKGDPLLEDQNYLRSLIDGLLQESAQTGKKK